MIKHKLENPACAFCGRTKKIQTHHKIPVSVSPLLAGIKSNMISLCFNDHLRVGHNGNFRGRYCTNIEQVCGVNMVTNITE